MLIGKSHKSFIWRKRIPREPHCCRQNKISHKTFESRINYAWLKHLWNFYEWIMQEWPTDKIRTPSGAFFKLIIYLTQWHSSDSILNLRRLFLWYSFARYQWISQTISEKFPFVSAWLNVFITSALYEVHIRINGTRLHSNEFLFFHKKVKMERICHKSHEPSSLPL